MPVKATGTENNFTLHFAKDVTVDIQKVGERKYRFTFEVEQEAPAADSANGQGAPGNAEHLIDLPLSEEALQFCLKHDLLKHLETAYAIALRTHPTVCGMLFRTQTEPGCEGIEIRLTVKGTVKEVLHWSSTCTDELIKALPPEALGRISVTERTI